MPVVEGRPRPLQNRVTPWGTIVATPQLGNFMGNRGRLHDADGRIVRQAERIAWICCDKSWPGIRRTLMAPTSYTELFFMDEATALSAGHRPCGECRRTALAAFKAAWRLAHGLADTPTVREIDAALNADRRNARPIVQTDSLPDGAMVSVDDGEEAWLLAAGAWRRWSFDGYGPAEEPRARRATLLTPAVIVATITAGYRPAIAI